MAEMDYSKFSPFNSREGEFINNISRGARKIASGNWYGPAIYVPSTSTSTLNLLMLTPLWVPETFTADRIACETTSAVASSTIRMGIYSNNSDIDKPLALLLDTGSIDASTIGVKEATISIQLFPGLYWLGAVNQGANPVMRSVGISAIPPVVATTFQGSSAGAGMNCYYSTVTGALPDPIGALGAGAAGTKVQVRAA